jgi:anaphase-promoting complex subunit 1
LNNFWHFYYRNIKNFNSNKGKKEEEDGMQHIVELETLKCRFNEDLRIKEVRACLQTTRPILIRLTQGPDVSDHEFIEEEEKFLSLVCQRTMALPVARGIFTLHTINPIPTEPCLIPELNLKGKSLAKKTTIDLARIELPANMNAWPLFHNGVAAGLTISPQARDLSNAWIKSHLAKNFELSNEQAGFLYGLGLTGHLANFSMLNVHDALTRRHDLTNIAILLGLASSK